MSFWETEPVCKPNENMTNVESLCDIKKIPVLLPRNMSFCKLNINEDMDDICSFLRQHYKSKVLFCKELIMFICDNYNHLLSLGIKKDGKLIAYVMVCLPTFQLQTKEYMAPYINIMCVHSDYRKQSLMQKLISELPNYLDYSSGMFVTNKQIDAKPFLISTCYQKVINPKKVYKSGLLKVDIDVKNFMKYNELSKEPDVLITKSNIIDSSHLYELYCKYMDKYNIHQKYSLDHFTRLLTNSIVECFTIGSADKYDFVMVYKTILRCDNDDLVRYNVFMYTSLYNTSYMILKNLCIALQSSCDVISVCGNYENDIHLLDLKFTQTNDKYYWFLYNKKILEQKELHTAITPIIS